MMDNFERWKELKMYACFSSRIYTSFEFALFLFLVGFFVPLSNLKKSSLFSNKEIEFSL